IRERAFDGQRTVDFGLHDEVVALGQGVFDKVPRSSVQVPVVLTPLQKAAAPLAALELLTRNEEVVLALSLPRPCRPGGGRNRVPEAPGPRQKRVDQRVFAGPRRAGYDEKKARAQHE